MPHWIRGGMDTRATAYHVKCLSKILHFVISIGQNLDFIRPTLKKPARPFYQVSKSDIKMRIRIREPQEMLLIRIYFCQQ